MKSKIIFGTIYGYIRIILECFSFRSQNNNKYGSLLPPVRIDFYKPFIFSLINVNYNIKGSIMIPVLLEIFQKLKISCSGTGSKNRVTVKLYTALVVCLF